MFPCRSQQRLPSQVSEYPLSHEREGVCRFAGAIWARAVPWAIKGQIHQALVPIRALNPGSPNSEPVQANGQLPLPPIPSSDAQPLSK